MLGNVEIVKIDKERREIDLVVHSEFTPNEIRNNPQALAAVERTRDAACRYLKLEGHLGITQESCVPFGETREWCIRTGVVHLKTCKH